MWLPSLSSILFYSNHFQMAVSSLMQIKLTLENATSHSATISEACYFCLEKDAGIRPLNTPFRLWKQKSHFIINWWKIFYFIPFEKNLFSPGRVKPLRGGAELWSFLAISCKSDLFKVKTSLRLLPKRFSSVSFLF